MVFFGVSASCLWILSKGHIMSVKKTTFKQRIRKNGMKERHKVSSQLRQRMGAGRRVSNRFDDVDDGGRPMEDILTEITAGTAIPSQETVLDPRSLTDLLLRPAKVEVPPTGSGLDRMAAVVAPLTRETPNRAAAATRKVLPTAPLPESDPLALPDTQAFEEAELKRRQAIVEASALHANRNQYKHHGQAYLFWERMGLHPVLQQALRVMKFSHPTPVQEEVLPSVLKPETATQGAAKKSKKKRGCSSGLRDVVVSAETGSGKTLVFALPILDAILRSLESQGITVGVASATPVDAAEMKGKKRGRTNSVLKSASESGALAMPKGTSSTSTKFLSEEDFNRRLMHSLIISPTRELAIQINEAMRQLTQFAPQVTIGCVVGGMAPEKQQRVLNRHPHVLICTPGRLWELVQKNEGCYLGHSISRRLHFVILDEADKLLQSGRFEELKNLLERIHCEVLPAGFVQEREEGAVAGEMELEAGRWDEETQTFVPFNETPKAGAGEAQRSQRKRRKKEVMTASAKDAIEDDADEEMMEEDKTKADGVQCRGKKDQPHLIPMPAEPASDHRITTYVTSATLSLQTNYERKDFRSHKSIIRTSNADVMDEVLQKLDISAINAQVFAISSDSIVAAKINETYLRCPDDSKDLYLYYFLKIYKDDRTIIFVNAISMLRRLVKLIGILGIPVVGLHASMQQRQRLKFVDKFKEGTIRVLVATDVASRGLDIDGLKHVVHYQVPRSTDAYIHRCGRTARCGGTGLSVLMVNAQEHMSFRKLLESLGRKESEMETFAVQPTIVHQLHAHLKVALQIDKLQKEIDKSRAGNQWVTRMSKSADIDVDDMYDDEADNENREKKRAIKVLMGRLGVMTKKFTGQLGGKGAFRTSSQALGAMQAEEKLRDRANRQALKSTKRRQ